MLSDIHIGQLIRNKLQENGRKECWLANKISCKKSNISKILQKSSINTDLLLEISIALDTNFFLDYSNVYEAKRLEKNNKD
jgi:plasmid maintenance system antidote protein VapI